MTDQDAVAFEAQVIEHRIKSLRSMDKQARLILEYKAEDNEIVNRINNLHSAEETVWVVITRKANE